ncbi:MAG: tetratricopeptide repeat protein [Myxococcota bacterium]
MKRTAILTLIVCASVAGAARSQPARNLVLESLTLRQRRESLVIEVHFHQPIRYLRHAPRDRGRDVQVQLQRLATAPGAGVPARLREALRPPPGEATPLREVVYEGAPGAGAVVEIRFGRDVEFDVRQGDDLRSLTIVVTTPPAAHSQRRTPSTFPELPPMPDPPDLDAVAVHLEHRFAVELEAVPEGGGPRPPPDHPLFERYRLYRLRFQSGDDVTYRYRLGFLPSRKAARQARDALAEWYPEASVVPTSLGERAGSSTHAVSARALRSAATPRLPRAAARDPSPAPGTDDAALLARGREAMTDGDLDLAIRLLTSILTDPTRPEAQEAQELLGLARERRGQLAHAKAEYEAYLSRYPDGEGAERVQRRLDALLTRSAPRHATLRTPRAEGPDWDVRGFGSLYTSYYRSDLWGGFEDDPLSESIAFTDLDVSTRARRGDLDVLLRGSASYRYDIPLDSEIDELRVGSLYVEASDRGRGLEGALGRQSANSGGVLGRFDGLRLGARVLDDWVLGGVAGFPVGLSRRLEIDTDRVFSGVSLDSPRFFESVEGQVWAIGQQADGMMDRGAVGAEVRYFAPSRFLAGFLDYDVRFGQLNTALLVGNWSPSTETTFHLTLDHRTTPILTLENALIGQPVASLHDLRRLFSDDEIEDLAADRTGRSSLGMLGMNHHLGENVQLNADATISKLDGTRASGGVDATDGTDVEAGLGLQLVVSGAFVAGDVTTIGLRGFAGDFADRIRLDLGSRLPLGDRIHLHPLLLLRWEDRDDGSHAYQVEPGLRGDLRIWKLDLDGEIVAEWTRRRGGADAGSEYGYRAQLGLRYDF